MRIGCAAAFVLLAALSAASQSLGEIARKNREAKESKKAARVLTNDDLSPGQADKLPPYLPGTVACGTDLKCFLDAIDKGTLAWVTKSEKAFEESVLLSTSTTWWTTRYAGDQCTVFIRLNEFSAEIDEERAKRRPQDRERIEAHLAEWNQQLPNIRGKDNTCLLTRSAVKKALTGRDLSVTTAAVLAYPDRGCTGPLFPDKR